MITTEKIERASRMSTDRNHLYMLSRIWNKRLPVIAFIGHKATANDPSIDTPEIRRLMRLADEAGYGGFYLLNLWSHRSTIIFDNPPKKNTESISWFCKNSEAIVAIWGGSGQSQAQIITEYITEKLKRSLLCVGLTAKDNPKSPNLLPKANCLNRFKSRGYVES